MIGALLLAGIASCESDSAGTGAGGTGGSGPPSGALAGTWDLVATFRSGSNHMGTLTWNGSSGSLEFFDATISVDLSRPQGMIVAMKQGWTSERKFEVQRRGSNGSTAGQLGFDPFGDWTIKDLELSNPGSCTMSLSGDGFTNTCDGGSGWAMAAQRTMPRESIFGDLGGDWTFHGVSLNSQPEYSCTARFMGPTFSAQCDRPGDSPKTVTLTVNGNMLSGTTNNGSYEFSGTRR